MITVPWCTKCGYSGRGTKTQSAPIYSTYPPDCCPSCGDKFAAVKAKEHK